MEATESGKSNVSLANVIGTAIQIPGVKVIRNEFLSEAFKDVDSNELEIILEKGPVKAGRSRDELSKKAKKFIYEKTFMSSGASFLAGLPGGLAMAATIPADLLQFYGVALRLAQELAYLYGEEDLWSDGVLDKDKVTNQLILYCGVMLGATGAAQTVRVLSSALSKQALAKLPQMALTKTFYYPIVKSIAKAFGVKMTKEVFAKGVSKAVPVIGGVVSGGITLGTMMPMGKRLANTLDEAHFSYSQESLENDMEDIAEVIEVEVKSEQVVENADRKNSEAEKINYSITDEIQKARQMLDEGIITEDEFSEIKSKLIKEI